MAVTMKIGRYEAQIAQSAKSNLLIYGRRKVGKTYLVRNFLAPDIYVLVKRGGGLYLEGAPFSTLDSHSQFLDMLRAWVAEGKIVAVDEFQRLPGDFPELLQTLTGDGRVILSGSSFYVVKEIISPQSPVLALFSDLRLSLISPLDILSGLNKSANAETAFELAPFLRDPWIIPYFEFGRTGLADVLMLQRGAVRSLIGEVFLDEEKKLSNVYEGVIRSLALGRWKLGQISDLLFSRGVLDRPDPHLIRPYFNNMEEMDLVRRVPIHGKKEFQYQIRSPLMELSFMLDEKYNFFQQDISQKTLEKVVDQQVPRCIERFCGDLFAQIYDGRFEYFYTEEFDIDFIITRGRKVLASGEVKWTDRVSRRDVDKFLERTKHLAGDKIVFSKGGAGDDRVISITPKNVLKWSEESIGKH